MSKIFISNEKKLLRGGASLTEVLFSAAIIALVVVSSVVIFVQTVDASKKMSREYTAAALAKNRLERVREVAGGNFDSLEDWSETNTMVDADGTLKDVVDPTGDYFRSTEIDPVNVRLTRVKVNVAYVHRGEKTQHEVTMETQFADY